MKASTQIKSTGSNCRNHETFLKQLLSAVLDATGHIHDGILNGNVIVLGNYDSCLDINVQDHEVNGTKVEGFQ